MPRKVRPLDVNMLILGGWLVASPWLLDFAHTDAARTAWMLGPIVVTLAFVTRGQGPFRPEQAVGILVGDLLFLAPWLFGYADIQAAAVNSWVVGLVVAAWSAWEFTDRRDRPRAGSGRRA